MNDEFLYKARPALRAEFVKDLYSRLAAHSGGSARWTGDWWKKVRLATAVVVAITIVAACAREIFRPRYVDVGGVWVLEVAPMLERRIQFLKDAGHGRSVSAERIPVEEAVERLPYQVMLPTVIPEGFQFKSETVMPPSSPLWWLQVEWENGEGDLIQLWSVAGEGGEVTAPRGAWTEVDLGGVSGVLLRGAFPLMPDILPTANAFGFAVVETAWDKAGGIQVVWNNGGGTFELRTFGDYLSEKELIRMAESMIEARQ